MPIARLSRTILSATLLLAVPLAMAQVGVLKPKPVPYGIDLHGADVPISTAEYYYYTRVVQASKLGSGVDLQVSIRNRLQLDEPQYQALLAHMRDTMDEAHAYEVSLKKGVCERRATFTSGSQVSAAFVDNERRVDARRAELVRGLAGVLAAPVRKAFQEMVQEYRSDLTVHGYDYTKFYAEHPEAFPAGLDQECVGMFGPDI